MDLEVEDVLQIGNLLGEGPVWDSEKGLLFWVDIEEHCFHSMCPAAAVAARKFDVGVPVYALGLVAGSDKLVMATSRGFALWNSPDGSLEVIADPEEGRPAGRLNDAAVDRQGNFWAGSLGPGFTSALYRLGPRRSVQKVESGIGASNGIGWSPDNRTMYFTDTRLRVIFAYDFDASSSTVANRRIWAQVPEGEGVPDGLTVDSEGCVWSVRWGFARVARYDPTGRLEREIALPVTYPTSCTFGGANLDELYVTSARSPLSQSLAAREPCAGDLFRIGVGVRGIEEARFRE